MFRSGRLQLQQAGVPARLREAEWGVVPYAAQVERLGRLQRLQRAITLEAMRAREGSEVLVLVEGPSRTDAGKLCGHAPGNQMVNFEGEVPPGAIARVAVARATVAALYGRLVEVVERPRGALTLPPQFALGDEDREKYAAIGESDCMTLRFVRL